MGVFKTDKFFKNQMKSINPNIMVLEPYNGVYTKLKCRCSIDGYEWKATPNNLTAGKGCPLCARNKTISGHNDVYTVRKDLLKYFNNIEEAKHITPYSHARISFVCPECGYTKIVTMSQISNYGFSCTRCSDGISYPNKFSRAFLRQLPIENLNYEWNPKWAKNYKYDNYFEYKGQRYILEMDGNFHYIDNNINNTSFQEQRAIDSIKDNLAKSHNIIVIRIDSQKSDMNYISQNILTSYLSDIFDLSAIDWNLCHKKACSSVLKDICQFYNNSVNKSTDYIGSVFCMNRKTIRKYLKQGNVIGWCTYNAELANKERLKNTYHSNSKKVNVFDLDKHHLYNFDSITECAIFMEDKYNMLFDKSSISKVCRKKQKHYKSFIFEYAI